MRNFLLTCKRGGESIVIGYRWPLWLDDVDGLTKSEFEVETEKGSGQDGEIYKSSTAAKRNIVIYCWIKDNHRAMRERLYSFSSHAKPAPCTLPTATSPARSTMCPNL